MTTTPWNGPVEPAADHLPDGIKPYVVSNIQNRSQFFTSDTDNGLYVGPAGNPPRTPDDYALTGTGLQGGEGVIWRAHYHGQAAQPIDRFAVKQLLPPPGMTDGEWPGALDLRAWWDTIHLLLHLRHPHLVAVHDLFVSAPPHARGKAELDEQAPKYPYILMEWIPGQSLREHVAAEGLTTEQRMQAVLEVAQALDALHSTSQIGVNAVVHGDVKPDNVVVSPGRGAVLVDIGGLRRLTDRRIDPLGLHTVRFAAPEVLADPRAPRGQSTDAYSLGAVAYYCLTGQDPVAADEPSAQAQLAQRLQSAVPGMAQTQAAATGLTSAVMAALSLDPASRPTRLTPWAEHLVRLSRITGGVTPPPPPPPPDDRKPEQAPPAGRKRWLAVAAVVVLLVAAGVVAVLTQGGDGSSGVVAENWVGRDANDVAANLRGDHVSVYQKQQVDSTHPVGTVIGQDAAVGKRVSSVTLTVAAVVPSTTPTTNPTTAAAPTTTAGPAVAPTTGVAPSSTTPTSAAAIVPASAAAPTTGPAVSSPSNTDLQAKLATASEIAKAMGSNNVSTSGETSGFFDPDNEACSNPPTPATNHISRAFSNYTSVFSRGGTRLDGFATVTDARAFVAAITTNALTCGFRLGTHSSNGAKLHFSSTDDSVVDIALVRYGRVVLQASVHDDSKPGSNASEADVLAGIVAKRLPTIPQ